MKKTRFGYIVLLLIFLFPVSLGALDFGFLVNQYLGYGNSEDNNDYNFEYRIGFVPRLSFLVGDTGSFFTSGSMTFGYSNEFYYVPELLRTELSMRFGALGLRAGRFNYSSPLPFIAEGLFDGIQFTHSSPAGRFGAGLWYTGLLYKKNINILMTEHDEELYHSPLNYSNFSNTYFAPRRLFTSVDWEHPSIAEFVKLTAAFSGQMDLSGKDNRLHSQYLILKTGIPVNNFLFEAGGSIGTAQYVDKIADDLDFNLAFAGEFGIYFILPTNFTSRFSFIGRFTTGIRDSDLLGAFNPITTKYYGEIFQQRMSGLTALTLNYSARLVESFGTSLTMSYFIRNGLAFGEENTNRLYGGEFCAQFIWSPVSDLQLGLGGGTFIPSMGNYWPDAKAQWRIVLTAVLAVF